MRIETRVNGAVYFLRGHVGLTAERAGVAVATALTDDEIHREGEFAAVMAEKVVSALLDSAGPAGIRRPARSPSGDHAGTAPHSGCSPRSR